MPYPAARISMKLDSITPTAGSMAAKPLRSDFLYGFATAAAQVEGGGAEAEKASGRGPSIWDTFCDKPGKIADGSKIVRTCNHYGKMKEDVAMMAKLGVNAYRFSVSWPRVIPKGGRNDPINEQGFQFYDDLINELLKYNITPFLTLFHWDLPQALYDRYGGMLNQKEFIADYTNYAKMCFDRYGDRVKHWLTFNEPWVICAHGYYHGVFAPGHKSRTDPWICAHTLIVAHAITVKMYREQYKPRIGGQIGITLNGDWAIPFDNKPENIKATQHKMDVAVGWFADPIYLGQYPDSMKRMLGDRLPDFTPEEIAMVKGSSDFYGMNFYTTHVIEAGGDDEANGLGKSGFVKGDGTVIGPESDLEWLRDVPWGLRAMLNYLWKRYQTPIYMTENGLAVRGEDSKSLQDAVNDVDRVKYYDGYVNNLIKAVSEDGVDIRSYFGWSFCDNFEWASGLTPRFGAIHVDYKTFERTPKKSSETLIKLLKDNIA